MSGFTVRAAEGVIDTGQTTSQLRSSKMKTEMLGSKVEGEKSFLPTKCYST